jgi:hypothetical protein
MNFHAKALLAFIAFQVIVTGGGLMFDQVPQALGQGANDNDTQLVGAVVFDAVDGRARHGVLEPGGLEAGAGQFVAGLIQGLELLKI